jgi:tetratricopeptide (TPR) repeat protein
MKQNISSVARRNDGGHRVDKQLRRLVKALGIKSWEYDVIAAELARHAYERFETSGEKDDIDLAVMFAQRCISYTSSGHTDMTSRLNNLGAALGLRYERTGEMADLEEAVRTARQAADLTPPEHPNRATMLNGLANKLERRYERTGGMADLEGAITMARQAAALTPPDHPHHAAMLNGLANKLERRYERTGGMADLEEAITTARQAVDSTTLDHRNRARRLSNLGNKLERRYERTGETADLEEAITTARQAVDSLPPDHQDRAAMLSNLGIKLSRRYERTSEMADLEDAIATAHQAVASRPPDHPGRAAILNNLSTKLGFRYERIGAMVDLEDAITTARQAVNSTPADHTDRAMYLNNLGIKLIWRYERMSEIVDLEDAIMTARQAIDSTPSDHPDWAAILNNLGNKLSLRYERTGEMADLEQAIATAQQAVDSTPPDHPDRAGYLNNLGNKLESRYERTQLLPHLQIAADPFTLAWQSLASVPFYRIGPSSRAIKILHRLGQYDLAAQVAEQVIDFLPVVNPRFLQRSDRQYILSRYSGIAADACAILLRTRIPGIALQCLEKGRAVILGQLIDDRGDITALKSGHPELALQFEMLRNEVNLPADTSDKDSSRLVAQRRRSAALELDRCIRSIQQLPGHTHFMSGLSEEDMQACAADGPIVIVNVSELGSDAIIVSPDSITSMALSKLLASEAKAWSSRDWHGRSKRGEHNKKYIEYLGWLWDVCVRPVLDAVDPHANESEGQLPRIWWVGSGLASSMPFHAAGVYSSWPGENALCRVVSSYAPSIKALAYSRSRCHHERAVQPKVLIATMPTTPNMISLPDVGVEKENVVRVLGTCTTVENVVQPTSELVTQALTKCTIAHFACHGRSDLIDPSNSGLIFARRDENNDIVQDPLTVHMVSETNLRNVRLVYLSACSTAENKAARLADEAIHIATGFQVAGIPHVVGCLWSSVDKVCAEIAGSFYTRLTQQGDIDVGNRTIAVALHQSVLAVAARDWRRPLNWVQFVHYGA